LALTLAHALGFGIYREGKLIQHFDDPALWEDIGYRVVNGVLAPSSQVTLERRPDSYPPYFSELLDREDAVVCRTFADEDEQARWIADSIQTNLTTDELEKDDILIVLPNAVSAKRDASIIMDALAQKGIDAHLAGVTQSLDRLFDKRSVAIANIFRSKGNEAPMVYIANSQHCYSGHELITLRNTLFTAITRCRAWVRICGWGRQMERLASEVEMVRQKNFRLDFTIPTEQELKKLRMIHRELTEAERAKRTRAERQLSEALQAVAQGDLPIESLPPELRTKLAKLLEELGPEDE
jgi:superfamily I DNA and RNA helicase